MSYDVAMTEAVRGRSNRWAEAGASRSASQRCPRCRCLLEVGGLPDMLGPCRGDGAADALSDSTSCPCCCGWAPCRPAKCRLASAARWPRSCRECRAPWCLRWGWDRAGLALLLRAGLCTAGLAPAGLCCAGDVMPGVCIAAEGAVNAWNRSASGRCLLHIGLHTHRCCQTQVASQLQATDPRPATVRHQSGALRVLECCRGTYSAQPTSFARRDLLICACALVLLTPRRTTLQGRMLACRNPPAQECVTRTPSKQLSWASFPAQDMQDEKPPAKGVPPERAECYASAATLLTQCGCSAEEQRACRDPPAQGCAFDCPSRCRPAGSPCSGGCAPWRSGAQGSLPS